MQSLFHILMSLSENLSSVSKDPPIPNPSLTALYVSWWFVGSSCWVLCTHFHPTLILLLYITHDWSHCMTWNESFNHLTTSWNATRVDKDLPPSGLLVCGSLGWCLWVWGRARLAWLTHKFSTCKLPIILNSCCHPIREVSATSFTRPPTLSMEASSSFCSQNPCPVPFFHSLDSSGL